MNPYIIIGVFIACGASFWYGTQVGADGEIAKQAEFNDVVREVREAAQKGAADAIAKNKAKNVTIQQRTEREIRTNTIYADCRNTPDGVRLINESLTGRPEPTSDSKLPGTNPAR